MKDNGIKIKTEVKFSGYAIKNPKPKDKKKKNK